MEAPKIVEEIKKALNEGNYRHSSKDSLTIFVLSEAPDKPAMLIDVQWKVSYGSVIEDL